MRISRSLAGAAVLLALSAAPAAGQGRWIAAYGPTDDPALSRIRTALRTNDKLGNITGPLNDGFRMPRDVTLEVAECGQPAAFYDPTRPAVQLCYELLAEMIKELVDFETRDDSLFDGAIWYVLMHQIGHAMIDVLELPTAVPAEEAADQFVAVQMAALGGDALGRIIPGVRALHEMGIDWKDPGSGRAVPSAAQMRDLECLAHASTPAADAARMNELIVADPRACNELYEAVLDRWLPLLLPHLRDDAEAPAP